MGDFDYFVIFADMRTGSNLLEASLNALNGVQCHGELFNPHFVGKPGAKEALGVSQANREAAPVSMIEAMRRSTTDLSGFRFFHDHDPRIFEHTVADPRCAKIVLTRSPLDAYISRKIAAKTNQWKLGDMKDRKAAKVSFDRREFEEFLTARQAFQARLRSGLQQAGQTAFDVTYTDILDAKVINGIAAYLGVEDRLKALPESIKKQNPAHLKDKVTNFSTMQAALAGFDWLDLDAAPDFEPLRGPAVPGFVAAARSPLIYLPVRGGPVDALTSWMEALDQAAPQSGFDQRSLRKWLRKTPGHRSFTVLRHPVLRAYRVFCDNVILGESASFPAIRRSLKRDYSVDLPEDTDNSNAVRDAFEGYLRFLEGNLAGQTSIRVDPSWATQASVLEGMGRFMHPDVILREWEIPGALANLAAQLDREPPNYEKPDESITPSIGDIYDEKIEKLVRKVYARDYLLFGFADWADQAA